MATKYRARIDRFEMDLETIEDKVELAIAVNEYPYRNGADLQHMGEKVASFRFSLWWLADRYTEYPEFRKLLKTGKLLELVHPVHGIMTGAVSNFVVRHDASPDSIRGEFDFLQQSVEDFSSEATVSLGAAVEESFEQGVEEQKASVAAAVRDELGAESISILEKALDGTEAIVSQFTGLSSKARTYLSSVDATVTRLEALTAEVAVPANTLVSTIDFGTDLPGRIIGTFAKTLERYSIALERLRSAPDRFLTNLRVNCQAVIDAAPEFSREAKAAVAQRLSLDASELFEEDETRRAAWRRREETPSFDASGKYRGSTESIAAIMTVREVEAALATVRTAIQEAIDANREAASLKAQARDLMYHVRSVKIDYENVREFDAGSPMPLILICHHAGLSMSFLERVFALNPGIKNPSFTNGRALVYAR